MIDVRTWNRVRGLFSRTFTSSLHFAIASVDDSGAPAVTPIGSVFLGEPGHAFYFELYATGLGSRLAREPRVSVLAVDSGRWRWGRALVRGAFDDLPAVRLRAVAAPGVRPPTNEELRRLRRRLGPARWLPGGQRLWPGIDGPDAKGLRVAVRDLRVERIETVRLGAMTVRL